MLTDLSTMMRYRIPGEGSQPHIPYDFWIWMPLRRWATHVANGESHT